MGRGRRDARQDNGKAAGGRGKGRGGGKGAAAAPDARGPEGSVPDRWLHRIMEGTE
jgi:hypothetical protein